jgi:hypothetical protein
LRGIVSEDLFLCIPNKELDRVAQIAKQQQHQSFVESEGKVKAEGHRERWALKRWIKNAFLCSMGNFVRCKGKSRWYL